MIVIVVNFGSRSYLGWITPFVDYAIPMIYKMYQKSLQTYKKLGYQVWDNEQSELYKSNLFNIDYQNHLARDLTNAKKNIVLTFPFLNKESYQFLVSLNLKNTSQNKYIFLPPIHAVSSNYQKNYRYYIEELKKLTYQIIFKEKVNQKFVIIDHNLIWSLPQKYQSEEGIALRIYSKEMASRLLSFFNDGSNS